MFEHLSVQERGQLSAKIRKDLIDEIDLLVEFVQEVQGSAEVRSSDVVEHIVATYFESRKREVMEFESWKEGDWPPSEDDDSERNSESSEEQEEEEEQEIEEGTTQVGLTLGDDDQGEPETGEIEVGDRL